MELAGINPLYLIAGLALLGLAPFLLMMVTSYVKIVVVTSLVRNALGVQQVPPAMVMNGLAIILTVFIMAPVAMDTKALLEEQRFSANPKPSEMLETLQAVSPPLRQFLEKNTSPAILQEFMGTAQRIWPEHQRQSITRDNMFILVPAFTITELTKAFQIFALFAFRCHRPYHFQCPAGHGHDDGFAHDHFPAVQAAAVRDAGRLAEDQSGPAAQLSVARFGGSMEVIVTEQDGIAIVELAGRMDATTTPEFENATRALLEAGKQRLLIDMSRLEYISSAGLRGILGLVKALKACAGKLAFCSLQPMTAEVFRISGVNAMLTGRDSRQEALAALAG